jgi:hypothetical protein
MIDHPLSASPVASTSSNHTTTSSSTGSPKMRRRTPSNRSSRSSTSSGTDAVDIPTQRGEPGRVIEPRRPLLKSRSTLKSLNMNSPSTSSIDSPRRRSTSPRDHRIESAIPSELILSAPPHFQSQLSTLSNLPRQQLLMLIQSLSRSLTSTQDGLDLVKAKNNALEGLLHEVGVGQGEIERLGVRLESEVRSRPSDVDGTEWRIRLEENVGEDQEPVEIDVDPKGRERTSKFTMEVRHITTRFSH